MLPADTFHVCSVWFTMLGTLQQQSVRSFQHKLYCCAAAGLLATIAAGCPIITRLLAAQRHNQQQQQQQQPDELCSMLLQLANCHLAVWAPLANATHRSNSSSSARSSLSSAPLLQTVEPVAGLAAELLLWPGVDGAPCWTIPLRAAEVLFCALQLEAHANSLDALAAASGNSSSSGSSSSSSGSHGSQARGSIDEDAAAAARPWVHLLHCPAVISLLASSQAVYAQQLRHSQHTAAAAAAAGAAGAWQPMVQTTSAPAIAPATTHQPAALAAYEMPRFHQDVLKAVGVPASELHRSSAQHQPTDYDSLATSVVTGAYLWTYHVQLLSTVLDNCSGSGDGAVGGSSSSSSSGSHSRGVCSRTFVSAATLQQAQGQQQRLLPPGVLQLLQFWPALQLELLLLVGDSGHKRLLLRTATTMLQTCLMSDASLSRLNAARSIVIKPLLQLVLPHMQHVIKELRAAAASSAPVPNSSSSSSSNEASVEHADALEQSLHALVLECLNGGEQQLWAVTA
jgi:hypothetical protein